MHTVERVNEASLHSAVRILSATAITPTYSFTEVGLYDAWGNGIDPDPLRPQLCRQCLGQAQQSRLADTVRSNVLQGIQNNNVATSSHNVLRQRR